jgi:hypothetical protein
MSGSTRRAFVKNSMAAAAGMTAIGALTGEATVAAAAAAAEPDAHKGSVVAYVRDARTGEVAVMSGDRTVQVRDRQLAARIARAAR